MAEETISIQVIDKYGDLRPTFVITRTEAIERMAHALCVKVHGPCDMCGNVKNGNEGHCNDYKSYAAAALDALLGD